MLILITNCLDESSQPNPCSPNKQPKENVQPPTRKAETPIRGKNRLKGKLVYSDKENLGISKGIFLTYVYTLEQISQLVVHKLITNAPQKHFLPNINICRKMHDMLANIKFDVIKKKSLFVMPSVRVSNAFNVYC